LRFPVKTWGNQNQVVLLPILKWVLAPEGAFIVKSLENNVKKAPRYLLAPYHTKIIQNSNQ